MRQHLLLLLVLLVTGPLAAQTHTRTLLVQAQAAELRVSSAPSGATAWFVFGFGGLGPGLCVPPSGPCLGVLAPLFIAPGVPVGASGTALLGFVVPVGTPLVPLATQALVLAPGWTAFAATNAIGGSVMLTTRSGTCGTISVRGTPGAFSSS